MKKDLALSNLDREVLDLAYRIKDVRFIKNHELIKRKLMIYLLNPEKNKPSLKSFAIREGLHPKTVKALRKSPTFDKEFKSFLKERFVPDSVLTNTIKAVQLKAMEGERWAAEMILEMGGILEKKNSPSNKFNFFVSNQNNKEPIKEEKDNNKSNEQIIDMLEGEDYKIIKGDD